MVKKKKTGDPLIDLLEAAKPEALITLIAELVEDRPDVRRECFDYLKKHASLIPEPKILEMLDKAWSSESLKIRMQRKEHDQAVAILLKDKYPRYAWDSGDELKTAKQLEERFPEQILTYYLSGLGNLNSNATRKEYTQRAKVMLKVRLMLVDVIKDESRWKVFAGKVKRENLRRPAFQEEFGKVIAGWRELA
jgi:hypothetical protein